MKRNLFLIICLLILLASVTGCAAIRPHDEMPFDTDKADTEIKNKEDDTEKENDSQSELHEHSYEETRVEPTCENDGTVEYVCSCGDKYSEKYKKAVGHDYNKEEIAPTCTADGLTRYTCKSCGYTFSENFVKATGHSYEKGKTVAPTTKDQGYTVYTCKNCNSSYKSDLVDKLTDPNRPADPPSVNVTGTSFDDCVFLGDSVSDMLELYNKSTGIFGKATFLTETSYSLYHCVNKNKTVTYNGVQMLPENAIAACGAKKVFIMLGTNDLVWADIDSTVSNMGKLVARIRQKCPDVQIIIQSQTPIYTAGQKSGLTNARVNEYNEKLKAYATSNGCAFVDIATPLKDSSGGLAQQYTSDNYVHINGEACKVWQATLKSFLGIK